MAKTANVYARIEPELKEAEDIRTLWVLLLQTPQQCFKQIVMHMACLLK